MVDNQSPFIGKTGSKTNYLNRRRTFGSTTNVVHSSLSVWSEHTLRVSSAFGEDECDSFQFSMVTEEAAAAY